MVQLAYQNGQLMLRTSLPSAPATLEDTIQGLKLAVPSNLDGLVIKGDSFSAEIDLHSQRITIDGQPVTSGNVNLFADRIKRIESEWDSNHVQLLGKVRKG